MSTDLALISIIIPVHNTEDFLEECLRSVIVQTYKNLEIIVIDDNSTDNSKRIIKRFQTLDKRIKYFFVDKHNAAQTRRKGIECAKAKYICFIDADDIIHEKYVELLYTALRKTGVKITSGKIYSIIDSSDIKRDFKETDQVTIESDLLAYFGNNYHSNLASRHVAQSINAKLFAKDVFKNVDYSVLKTSLLEDNYIMAQILHKMSPKKIALIDSTIYYYRQNNNSTMGRALEYMIPYENTEISYPQLFEKTMKYIAHLYKDSKEIIFYINKIKSEEYYNLAETVVNRNIRIKYAEKLLEQAKARTDLLEFQRGELILKNEKIRSSKSYKIGRLITLPGRILKQKFIQR